MPINTFAKADFTNSQAVVKSCVKCEFVNPALVSKNPVRI